MGFGDIFKKAAPIVGGIVGGVVGGPAGAAIGFGIGSTASSAMAGMEAEDAAKDAAKSQRRLAQLENRRNRLELIREFSLAQSQAAVLGEASGAGVESSRIQGVRSSLGGQSKGNLQFNAQGLNLSNNYYSNLRDSYNAATQANLLGAGASLAMMASRSLPSSWPSGGAPNKTTPVYTAPRSPQAAPTSTDITLTPYGQKKL